ncbi:hypothetical protein ECC02_009758 [Trypanosoma cruzi]|uniref:Uncharacterized protein n=1 Tax=Trypanosoma cruzi TaxID=5693 RepID=A0A7J6XSE8_TRYCR|nr:hypothetical protein ECC02_009758 [Trypanosoma cruzi]
MGAPPEPATVDGRSPLITPDTLHEIVAEYLQSAGMREVAADMRRHVESTRASTDDATTIRQPSREDRTGSQPPSVGPSAGALEWCLCSYAATRLVVRQLLSDGASKLTSQFKSMDLPAPDETFVRYALDSNDKHMWSVQDDVDALYVAGVGWDGHGMPMFGTLHQIIEALTHVSVLPLSTPSEEKLLAQEEFTHAFLRQHRYFTSSHTVLAKLMERFTVPLSVKLGFENFEAHGIRVHAPGTSLSAFLSVSRITRTHRGDEKVVKGGVNSFSPSASLWLFVCQSIQMRVMSVLTLWLREYPQHFDDAMHHSIHLFLDDCSSISQPWSDCPSQLHAMMEFVRDSISAAAEKKRTGTLATRQHRLTDGPPTLTSSSPSRTVAAEENSFTRRQAYPTCIFLLRALTDVGSSTEFRTESWVDKLQEVVNLCLALSVEQYAAGLMSLHLHLFTSLQAEEVLKVLHRSSAAYLSSSSFHLTPVGAFLASSTDLSAWTVSVLLHAAALDGHQMRDAGHISSAAENFLKLYKYLVELVVALVRLNDLHGAVAVHRGLHHPILQRVLTQPRIVALIPESTSQNVTRLHEILGICSEKDVAKGKSLENYMRGILDVDAHPLIPPLQHYLGKMTRLKDEMPSFLTLRTDELYPSTDPGKKTREIVLLHWRKYIILDRMVSQLKVWHSGARPTAIDRAFENQFVEQKRKIIWNHWQLAEMANELLSAL